MNMLEMHERLLAAGFVLKRITADGIVVMPKGDPVRGFCFDLTDHRDRADTSIYRILARRGLDDVKMFSRMDKLDGTVKLVAVAAVPEDWHHCSYCDKVHDRRVVCPEYALVTEGRTVPRRRYDGTMGMHTLIKAHMLGVWIYKQERRLI